MKLKNMLTGKKVLVKHFGALENQFTAATASITKQKNDTVRFC